MNWRVVLEQDPRRGTWSAWCPELPGCASGAGTREEALENIREAIDHYLERRPLPIPPSAEIEEVAV